MDKFSITIKNFSSLSNDQKLAVLLGEGPTALIAAQYIAACHELRDTKWPS